jgi:hypothetical protein
MTSCPQTVFRSVSTSRIYAADNRADLFEELAPGSLVGRKKFSLRARLADAWLLS